MPTIIKIHSIKDIEKMIEKSYQKNFKKDIERLEKKVDKLRLLVNDLQRLK